MPNVTVFLKSLLILWLCLSLPLQAEETQDKPSALSKEQIMLETNKLAEQAKQFLNNRQYDEANKLYITGIGLLRKKLPDLTYEFHNYINNMAGDYKKSVLENRIMNDMPKANQLFNAPSDMLTNYRSKNDIDIEESEIIIQALGQGLQLLDQVTVSNNDPLTDKVTRYKYHTNLGNLKSFLSMSYSNQGQVMKRNGNYDEALKLHTKSLEAAQQSIEEYRTTHNILIEIKETTPEAKNIPFLDIPTYIIENSLQYLIATYQDMGQYDKIKSLMEKYKEYTEQPNTLPGSVLLLMDMYLKQNLLKEGVQYAENKIQKLASSGNKEDQLTADLISIKAGLMYERLADQIGKREYPNKNDYEAVVKDYYMYKAEKAYQYATDDLSNIDSLDTDHIGLTDQTSVGFYRYLAFSETGQFYLHQSSYQQADDYFQKALHAIEQSPDHQQFAFSLRHWMAINYRLMGDLGKATELFQQNLDNLENSLEPGEVGSKANSYQALAKIYGMQNNMPLAIEYLQKAQALYDAQQTKDTLYIDRENQLAQLRLWILSEALAGNLIMPAEANTAALQAIQKIHGEGRTLALQQAALRLAGNDQTRQQLKTLWDQEKLLEQQEDEYHQSLIDSSTEAQAMSQQLAEALANTRKNLAQQDNDLRQTFPAYNRLINPMPLELEEVQHLLHEKEAMLVWVLSPGDPQGDPEYIASFLLVIHPDRAKLIQLRNNQLTIKTALEQHLYALHGTASHGIPMNLNIAHNLYKALLAPAESELAGVEHIIAVPDDTLRALPLHTLLASAPNAADPTHPSNDDYANADWLLRHYPISYLPAVNSLAQLRSPELQRTSTENGRLPFLGFGDPLLDGGGGNILGQFDLFGRGATRGVDTEFATDTSQLRGLQRLPNTATELRLGADLLGADPDKAVFTGKNATESEVKRLNDEGMLAKADILAFATHAYAASEAATGDASRANRLLPGLVMTPPAIGSLKDDGYVNANEIANLNLNSEWVTLAACNTAKASSQDTSGLSQLVRAFFIAGTYSVLATHWSVDDDATHRIMTHMFKKLGGNPALSRAEALRQSMADQLAVEEPECGWLCGIREFFGSQESSKPAHPAYWGAFVVYGEGGVAQAVKTAHASKPVVMK